MKAVNQLQKCNVLLAVIFLSIFTIQLYAKPVDKEKVIESASNISLLDGKLVNSQEIMKGFEQGKDKVKIIVNLTEPPKIRDEVRWKSKASLQELQDKIKATQLPVLSSLDKSEFNLRHRFENQAAFSGEVTLKALEKLIDDPCVVSIEPVFLVEPHLKQGIPLMDGDIYRSTYNGQGIAIAICDTGIDYNHPMLGGGGFPNAKVIGGYDFGDDDSDPMPDNSQAHGTACAGIAAGDLNTAGDYIGGIAYNARLYALKITSGADGTAGNDDIIAAWDWCITHRNDDPSHPIMVISTSFGGGRYFSECSNQTANNAVAAGITVLASAGNDGYCNSISTTAP